MADPLAEFSLRNRDHMAAFTISLVYTEDDLTSAKGLIEIYTQSLGIDLAYQDHATEMARMPGKYGPPTGALLLARNTLGEAIGCVGLRPLEDGQYCEMKRLYVDPKGRGLGVGKALSLALITEARRLGYSAMRLDSLSTMKSALALYESLGFRDIEPYYWSPIEGTRFLELKL